jgi:hypothetical protein
MLSTIVVLGLLAVVLWVGWTLWKSGWDWKKAAAAIVAAAAAAWLWLQDSVTSLTSGL